MQFFAFNSQSKIDVRKGQSEYACPGSGDGSVAYVVRTGKTTVKVITSFGCAAGEDQSAIGKYANVAWQSGAGDRNQYGVEVIGFVDENGRCFGEVPAKSLPHFVMK